MKKAEEIAYQTTTLVQEGLVLVLERLEELSGNKLALGNLLVSKELVDGALGVLLLKEKSRHKKSLKRSQQLYAGASGPEHRLDSKSLKKTKNLLKCKTAPGISIRGYIIRLASLGSLPDSFLITTLIYILRIFAKNPGLDFSNHSPHKLISTSLFLATKYVIDQGAWFLKEFGKLAGVSPKLLKKKSVYMADSLLDWDLFVPQKEYKQVENFLISVAGTHIYTHNTQN